MLTKQQQLKHNKKPRKKKCKECKEYFIPERDFQSTCSPKCAYAYATNPVVKLKAINKVKKEANKYLKVLKEYLDRTCG